jgi:hypothetical protein
MGKAKNLTGQKFGKLTVIRDIGRLHGGVLWECVCECGRIANVRASNLKSGDSKTCGKRRQCHHAWEGGHKNVGSIAWAKKKITAARKKAEKRGYLPFACTPEQYLELWKRSNNRCELCGTHESETQQGYLCVDHCHETGKVRGVLCGSCNSGIGMFAENTELMQKAIEYIVKNNQVVTA